MNQIHVIYAQEYGAYTRPGFMARDGSTAGYLDYFLPLKQNEHYLFFLNPKVSFTDDDANEQNLGFGYRRLSEDANRIMGLNLFYDTRQSTYFNRFQQVGLGLEMLTKWFDYRVNYYHPTSNAKRTEALDSHGFGATSIFRQNGYEEPLRGLDWEIGIMIPKISEYVETRVYGGGFHYESKKFENRNGGRFRVELRPNKLFTLELKVDHVQGDDNPETSFGGYFTLPFEVGNIFQGKNPFEGWKEALSLGQGYRSVKERMTERVVRDLDIVSNSGPSGLSEDRDMVRDNVIYVDNSNTSGTDNGTLDSPYNTVSEATEVATGGSLIYVFKGTGSYFGNYVVPDNVDVAGGGDDLGFQGLPTNVPPTLDGNGVGGSTGVLTLSGKHTISGLNILNASRGIDSTVATVDLTIRNNTVTSNSSNAISITHAGGGSVANILNNTVSNVPVTENGIFLQSSSGSGTMTATVSGNAVTGGDTGINVSTDTTSTVTVNFTISNNTVSDSATSGISVIGASVGGSLVGTISNNTTNNNGTVGGIDLAVSVGSVNGTVTNNTSNSNVIGINLRSLGTGSVTSSISNNTLFGNTTAGVEAVNSGGGTNTITSFTNNSIRAASGGNHLNSSNSVTIPGGGNYYEDANSTVVTSSSSLSLGGTTSGSITFTSDLLTSNPN